MKRIDGLYQKIICIENLKLADQKARKGKGFQYGVKDHDKNRDVNIINLHRSLVDGTYRTSGYITFKIREPKEREIFRLPYYPDRILHHAVMNILEPIFIRTFTSDTYSCIKGRGIHGALKAVKKALRDVPGTEYCMKLDIKKFYPNIDHRILKQLLRKKFKDQDLLRLLDEIIDSAPGLPIGNYLSQYFANFYLTYFDHWIKEQKGVKYYFRYLDDMVFLAPSKPELHQLLADIRDYLMSSLQLELKSNYQIFPVEPQGIDFVGYVIRHYYVLVRKSIKKNFARKMAKNRKATSIASYYGWLKHCNGRHLFKKLAA